NRDRAYRSTVQDDLLGVDDCEVVPGHRRLERVKRQVTSMGVVDHVELPTAQRQAMNEFERDQASGPNHTGQPGHEIVQVGCVGERVIDQNKIELTVRGDECIRGTQAEDALLSRRVRGRADACIRLEPDYPRTTLE